MSQASFDHIHESPWVVWVPLVVLAIPSVIIGYVLYDTMVLQQIGLLAPSLFILPEHNVLATIAHEIHSPGEAMVHALSSLSFGLTLLGIVVSWLLYCVFPRVPARIAGFSGLFYKVLLERFGFDAFYDLVFVRGGIAVGKFFSDVTDHLIIDGFFVNGFARFWGWLSGEVRLTQSGYVYHYVGLMVFGLLFFLCWLMWV
jgi:NADH-quinone oxidoreductase subunit L